MGGRAVGRKRNGERVLERGVRTYIGGIGNGMRKSGLEGRGIGDRRIGGKINGGRWMWKRGWEEEGLGKRDWERRIERKRDCGTWVGRKRDWGRDWG